MAGLKNLSGGQKPVSDIPDIFHYKVAEKEYEFSLLSSMSYTSYVYRSEELVLKIIKSYEKYQVYEREVYMLKLLEENGITWSPRIVHTDDVNQIIVMTYCGELLTELNKPKNLIEQMNIILNDLKRLNIQHNDIKEEELLVLNGKLYLCDFGWASLNGFLSCGFNWNNTKPDGIKNDTSIVEKMAEGTLYLNKDRGMKGSQSETPSIQYVGDMIHIGGYQSFKISKQEIIFVSKNKKYSILLNKLRALKTECETVNDVGSNTGITSYTAAYLAYKTVYALDHDKECIPIINELNQSLNVTNVIPQQYSFGDEIAPSDITIMLALIHWIYSCTSLKFLAFDPIFKYLKTITKKYLLIEWIDTADPAIRFFKHLDYNKEKHIQEYNKANFEASCTTYFGDILDRIEVDGETRVLYVVRRRD